MGRMSARPPVRWFQFRLRSLLIALTLLAVIPGGYIVHERGEAQRQTAAVAKLKELGAEVYARPNWLHTLLVPGAPGDVVGVGLRQPYWYTPEDLAPLADLSELVWIDLQDSNVTDDALVRLASLPNLERLRLDETQITDAGLLHLAGLPKLHTLNLSSTKITDAGLAHLARLPNLKELYIQKTQVTPAGTAKLQQALPEADIVR
jgi:Leucine-rich repeat (LRR) protein